MEINNNKKMERTPWLRSLGGKFVLLTVLVLSIILGASAAYNYKLEKSRLVNELNFNIQSLVQFTTEISANAVLSYDFGVLDSYMETLTQNRDVVYAMVKSPDGRLVTSVVDKKSDYIIPHDELDLNALIDNINNHEDIITLSFPIKHEESTLAVIIIGVSEKRIKNETRQSLVNQLSIGAAIIFILSSLIYIIFRQSALRPISELADGARRIQRGKLDIPVCINSMDELGILGKLFNEMMETLGANIKQKDEALFQHQQLNKTLEIRVRDRTRELEKVNRELEYLALHDSLTSLPNRALINDRFKYILQGAKRDNEKFSLIMIDLNRFKEVNDTLGHDCGDSLLIEVGKRLLGRVRKRDTVGRLGGDEFVIILPKTDLEGATIVAKNILETMEEPIYLQRVSFTSAASLGIAIYPDHGTNYEEIMKSADLAMYHAKQNHDSFSVYDSSFDNVSNPNSLSLVGELKEAIANNELQLFYQPQKDVKTQHIIGVEALARWIHPEKGFIPPDEFIPLAERTGLIRPLTFWVLNEAMRQWSEWTEKGIKLKISINVSMQNIQDANFINQLLNLLDEWKMGPEFLCLEITESTIMSNTDYAMNVLQKIEDLNVELSIDDFGTGYSSLSQLKQLPVQELKVDRSFVMDMVKNSHDLCIVKSIINMAHTMGLHVVAEGVEDEACELLLREMGCDRLQGYHICRPQPPVELIETLKQFSLS